MRHTREYVRLLPLIFLAPLSGFLLARKPTLVLVLAGSLALLALALEPAVLLPFTMLILASSANFGPVVVSVTILLLAIPATFAAFLRGGRPGPTAVWLAALLVGFVTIQLLTTNHQTAVLPRTMGLFAGVCIAFTVRSYLAIGVTRLRRIVASFVAIAALEAGLGILQALTASLLIAEHIVPSTTLSAVTQLPGLFRATGTFAHPNSLGIMLVMSLPFSLWLLRVYEQRRAWVWIAIVLITVGALATYSRAVFLALGTTVVILIWINKSLSRAAKLLVLSVALIGATTAVLGPLLRLRRSAAFAARDAGSNEARVDNMQAALAGWLDAPVAGHGLGTGPVIGYRYGGYRDLGAHNTYLDVLQGGGVVFAGLLLAATVYVCRRNWSQLHRAGSALFLLPILIVVLGLFESLMQPYFLPLLGLSAGMIVVEGRRLVLSSNEPCRDEPERKARLKRAHP